MKEHLWRLLSLRQLSRNSCRQRLPHLLQAIQTLRDSGFAAAQTLAQTLSEWIEEIARMWRFSRNNGITEGFHRKMKLIQRRAYGFRSFHNYRLRVIAQCG
jgi:transposase